ncbi:MAG TPA: serine protease [Pyrinomonadaceae bacterium]|jgi:S1-C subfamily serine protease
MKRKLCSVAFVVVILFSLAQVCAAEDTSNLTLKQSSYTVSLELKFSRKNQNPMQRAISFLDLGPNGYATGFLVGDGLVMTAYHVVSGELSLPKRVLLGFGARDQLEVAVHINGCQATVLKVDKEADLALLRVCPSQKRGVAPAFQASLSKDEKILLIARPRGNRMVRRGIFYGTYLMRGQEYWAAKIDGHDGYSGSPVYNDRAELVGVFSGYDWAKRLAVISPGVRAQKLLEDYISTPQP